MWCAKVGGEPPELLSRNLRGRHVSEIALGLGISCWDLAGPKPLSELCLVFQIRQADYLEFLYMNYL